MAVSDLILPLYWIQHWRTVSIECCWLPFYILLFSIFFWKCKWLFSPWRLIASYCGLHGIRSVWRDSCSILLRINFAELICSVVLYKYDLFIRPTNMHWYTVKNPVVLYGVYGYGHTLTIPARATTKIGIQQNKYSAKLSLTHVV